MTSKLSRNNLISLERYATERAEFRDRVLAHKAHRSVALGPNVRLLFEDALTIQYQIQEMLRVERIFEAEGINEELDAYNPLIPDGTNLKATMMIEYPDVDERRRALARLLGIEHSVWMQVAGFDRVLAVADEDMDRADGEKTSAVHFLRFEFTAPMITAARESGNLSAGIDHRNYGHDLDPLPAAVVKSLLNDFQ